MRYRSAAQSVAMFILLLGTPLIVNAQEIPTVNVFLDCRFCDFDFLRREISFVNYVRNRDDADIHILVTEESTGSGTRHQLQFIGQGIYRNKDYTLPYTTSDTDTDDERRRGMAQTIKAGLLQYLVDTPLFDQFTIIYTEAENANVTPEKDPWNLWVFKTGFTLRLNGQSARTTRSFSGNFGASRTSEEWKIETNARISRRKSTFTLSGGDLFVDERNDFNVDGSAVKSMGPHWGSTFGGGVESSTFDNLKRSLNVETGVQYNIFPFSEASQRLFTFTYLVRGRNFLYTEKTIFNKTEETKVQGRFQTKIAARQPWGNGNISVSVDNFLDAPSFYRINVDGSLNYRIVRGLSLFLFGSISSIHDQISLPRGVLSNEEILLQRRALDTNFRYNLNVGFSYTFGSIFNNIINSRF